MTQKEALKIMKTGANVFLTGEPGAGKTHVVNEYVKYLREHGIEPAITASTGIAATHIQGQTIHSWSGIGIRKSLTPYDLDHIETTEYIVRRIRKTSVLIIDEVSMIDANTLDMVDMVSRQIKHTEEPFGGIQIILVGDFFQLPPVGPKASETNFAFQSNVWRAMSPIVCYLSEQHRQNDVQYSLLLNAIRSNYFDQKNIDCLKKCVVPLDSDIDKGNLTQLFSHNIDVDKINSLQLERLPDVVTSYVMTSKGKDSLVKSLMKGCLSPERLELKTGAIVMCTKNNNQKGYVNGTLGTVVSFEAGTKYPIIETRQGFKIVIEPVDWIIEENGKQKAMISQIPLRLAWAITIHKSQGMSLESAIIDLREVFEYGQGYVALSRLRSLEGLRLLGWNDRALQVHPKILDVDKIFKNQSETARVIFSDMPQDQIETMQKNFVLSSGGTIESKAKSNKNSDKSKINTIEMTLMLVLQGKNIETMAKERNLSQTTIFGHIEKLVANGKLSLEDIEYLIDPGVYKNIEDIKKTFINYDTTKLAPIYEHYKGHFSYDQLRLARMVIALKRG